MGLTLATHADDVFPRFAEMRIKHPYHEDAVATFEKLRKRKLSAPNAEQTAASLFAGSRSGKTTTVRWYIEQYIVDEWLKTHPDAEGCPRYVLAAEQTLALHVELSGSTTMSGLMSDFLIALGAAHPFQGTPKERLYRVEKTLQSEGYQIIFLDETQHIKLQAHAGSVSRRDDATEVQNSLKRLVKKWPIIFVGTQHAENVVFEHQVYTRSDTPIKFGPLHFGNEIDAEIFKNFCGRLILKIVQHRILKARPEILVEGDVPLCLNIATKGRLGLVTVLARIALEKMFNLGERVLTRSHLEAAVEDFTLRIGVCSYNPFTDGPKTLPSIQEYHRDE